MAAAVWTDPPYNVDYQGRAGKIMNDKMSPEAFREFLAAAFRHIYQSLVDGGPIYVAHSDTESPAFRGGLVSAGFHIAAGLVWVKNSLVLGRGDYQMRHEPILYGYKPTGPHLWFGGRKKTTVMEAAGGLAVRQDDGAWALAVGDEIWRVSGERVEIEAWPGTVISVAKPVRNKLHPTMKPVELIERCLANSTRPEDLVLDPFGGSGSTLMACERLGRRARLLELDPKFAGQIVARWETYTGRQAERLP